MIGETMTHEQDENVAINFVSSFKEGAYELNFTMTPKLVETIQERFKNSAGFELEKTLQMACISKYFRSECAKSKDFGEFFMKAFGYVSCIVKGLDELLAENARANREENKDLQ